MLKGFKDFILRGNVLDLAVAVVVGAAFTAIVTSFTSNIVEPLISVLGGHDEMGWGVQILSDNPATFINLGAVVSSVINFVIIAAVVYFVLIVPATVAKKRFSKPSEKAVSDTDLLTEIRDLLKESSLNKSNLPELPKSADRSDSKSDPQDR